MWWRVGLEESGMRARGGVWESSSELLMSDLLADVRMHRNVPSGLLEVNGCVSGSCKMSSSLQKVV
jgi:hypothetical protein